MISIVELIGGVSILMASGFLLIFIKESVFDQTTEPELEFQNTDSSESFINIDIDALADDGTTKNDTEQVKEKRRRLESFKIRNKFYH